MDLLIYNTLHRKKERFEPLHAPNVGMYVCGPTVYGDAHLGHARPAITFDILFRYLRHLGYKVRYVRNITDVGHLEHDADEGDDKIAKKARLEQLKNTLKRKLLDTMGKPPETAAIIEETYTEIENELTCRIAGLEKQIDAGNTLRNNMLKVNRAAKTVIDVFDDILRKPTLDKRDISFLVERISVYTDHLDVKLKPDIDTLLKLAPDHEDSINFSTDSKDIASTTIVQRSTHRKDKVFTVNVVNEGDPLEIAKMLKRPDATVRTRLARARKLLKRSLGDAADA